MYKEYFTRVHFMFHLITNALHHVNPLSPFLKTAMCLAFLYHSSFYAIGLDENHKNAMSGDCKAMKEKRWGEVKG